MSKLFLNQAMAKALDVELMSSPGFSLDQLMELAGLSVSWTLSASGSVRLTSVHAGRLRGR